jgi:hypothetical protein
LVCVFLCGWPACCEFVMFSIYMRFHVKREVWASKPRQKGCWGVTTRVARPWALPPGLNSFSSPPSHIIVFREKFTCQKNEVHLTSVRYWNSKLGKMGVFCSATLKTNERRLCCNLQVPINQCKTTRKPHISCLYHKIFYQI